MKPQTGNCRMLLASNLWLRVVSESDIPSGTGAHRLFSTVNIRRFRESSECRRSVIAMCAAYRYKGRIAPAPSDLPDFFGPAVAK